MSDREPQPAVFAAAPHDVVEDLVGDLLGAHLRALVAGNQFMAMPDLVAGFAAFRPDFANVFYETLPPGVLQQQLRSGVLHLGSLELRFTPDVLATSPEVLEELHAQRVVGAPKAYASNGLALLVKAGNPMMIAGWDDVLGDGIRVAFPDPRTEGIGRLALRAIALAVGDTVRDQRCSAKARAGEWVTTSIHHRQGPAWLLEDSVDVAVVWQTEARHHLAGGAALTGVDLSPEHEVIGDYAVAAVAASPHREAAEAFVNFVAGSAGREVFARHGFNPPRTPANRGATQ